MSRQPAAPSHASTDAPSAAARPDRRFAALAGDVAQLPQSPLLAAQLAAASLKEGVVPEALDVLSSALESAAPAQRAHLRRRMAWLHRHAGDLPEAREQLTYLLAEQPSDRRARAVLNGLLWREERWAELDASLEKESSELLKAGALQAGARVLLRRGTLWGGPLKNPARAALRYGQAAGHYEEAKDAAGAFDSRLLALRSLKEAGASQRALAEQLRAFLTTAQQAGRAAQARALMGELGLLARDDGQRTTVRELLAVADALERVEGKPAREAPGRPGPDEAGRLEARYVARGAWRELAELYRAAATRSTSRQQRVDNLTKLAELLEDELGDLRGAAAAYGEIVKATGDRQALAEQVRLLGAQHDVSAVRRALDDAVERAPDVSARTQALLVRAEANALKQPEQARADFEAALASAPDLLPALAGLAEVSADPSPYQRFKEALQAYPRRAVDRAGLLRRLARLADGSAADRPGAGWAWGELLTAAPLDEEARVRLEVLARELGDEAQLEHVLRAIIKAEPRGLKTRRARLELVELLEESSRRDEALNELRSAVRFEPGHQEAWVLLTERLLIRGMNGEAAWALEHAATATENDAERARLWLRLAQLCRDVLKDPVRAAQCEARAANINAAAQEARGKASTPNHAPTELISVTDDLAAVFDGPLGLQRQGAPKPSGGAVGSRPTSGVGQRAPPAGGPRDRIPTTPELPAVEAPLPISQRPTGVRPSVVPPPPPREASTASDAVPSVIVDDSIHLPQARASEDEEALQGHDDAIELHTGDYEAVEGLPFPQPSDLGEPSAAAMDAPTEAIEVTPTRFAPPLERPSAQREGLVQRIQENPLDPAPYLSLAELFARGGDPERSELMAEIGAALGGTSTPATPAPKLMLSATDRAGLRHPALRGEAGELLSITGAALVCLYRVRGRAAGASQVFRLDSGKGAPSTASALLAAVRVLGLRAPDVHLSMENGPPFALVYLDAPRLLVGQLAIKRDLDAAELRFFAGRALFTQNPDLQLLRALRRDQLARAIEVLGEALGTARRIGGEAKLIRERLPPKAVARAKELYAQVGRSANLTYLAEAARHSANRAGLVVSGAVGPALAALRAKRALDSELVELIRYAASERYLSLRRRRLG